MRKITVWVANDGCRFDKASDCKKYEVFAAKVAKVVALLPPVPKDDGCSFGNGHGYIQHDPKVVKQYKGLLLDLIETKTDHKWVKQARADNIHPSWIGRLLSDMGNRPLDNAWYRMSCMDKSCREWGQPYFANNPDKGDQKCLNSWRTK